MKSSFQILFLSIIGLLICDSVNGQSDDVLNAQLNYLRLTEHEVYDSSPDSIINLCTVILASKKELNEKIICFLHYKKGKAQLHVEQNDSAIKNLHFAYLIANSNQLDTLKGSCEANLGLCYLYTGISDSSLYYHQRSFETFSNLSDSLLIAKSHINLANSHSQKAEYPKALEHALEGNSLYKTHGDDFYHKLSLVTTANIYEKLKKYEQALLLYNEAYDTMMKLEQKERAATIQTNMAVIYYRQKNYLLALSIFKELIDYYRSDNKEQKLSLIYGNISRVYNKLGQHTQAMEALEASLKISKKYGLLLEQTSTLLNLGNAAKKAEQFAQSEAYYIEALKIAKAQKFRDKIQSIYKNLSKLYATQENYRSAYIYRFLSGQEKDTINSEKNNKHIAELMAKYKAEEKQTEILRLENENIAKELKNNKVTLERNILRGTGIGILIILLISIWFYRVKNQKDKIISAQQIKQLEDEKKIMAARAVVEGQEKERQRIARELHDGIGVLLSTASIHFSNLEESSSNDGTSSMAKKANDFLQKAGTEVRKISHNMMPGVLMKFGLSEALEDLLEELIEATELKINYHLQETEPRFAENIEIMVYRIVQEMLNNTLKHANASIVNFNLTHEPNILKLNYSDNGSGFDQELLKKSGNLGLSGLYSRVDFLNGTIQLETAPGKGCSYLIQVPVE